MASAEISCGSVKRAALFVCSFVCVFVICACKSSVIPTWHIKASARQGAIKEAYLSALHSVAFDITPVPSAANSRQWIAKYTKGGKTVLFRIFLEDSTPPPGKKIPHSFVIGLGNGRIEAEPGSDDTILLVDLKKALEASELPEHVHKEKSLPFTYVVFGEDQSQVPGGGFQSHPAGHWSVMKAFLGDDDDGEFYLNINSALGKAQLSEKDSSYGNYVLAKLATVL